MFDCNSNFAGCKPALPERRGHLGLIVHTTFPYMRYQYTVFARLQLTSQVANLRYRNGEALRLMMASNVSSHALQKAKLDDCLLFETCAGCKPALPEWRRPPTSYHRAYNVSLHALYPIAQIMFACGSRLRRLQTCATGMERPFTSHHGPNVFSHAQYQEAQLDIRLQFKFSQVANLRYRSA